MQPSRLNRVPEFYKPASLDILIESICKHFCTDLCVLLPGGDALYGKVELTPQDTCAGTFDDKGVGPVWQRCHYTERD